MFTGSHLTVFIINALLPLFWIIIIIRNLLAYSELKADAAASKAKVKLLKEQLPNIENLPDEAAQEAKHFRDAAEVNADLLVEKYNSEMKYAKYNTVFWLIIGFMMSLCAVCDSIEIGIKLYHSQCPCTLRQSSSGPSFTATIQNVKLEEEKKDD